jgi:membrane protein DedA with SNARE-associated domain
MNDLISLISRHGYSIVFGMALAEALGFPVPAALALITAGASVAFHLLWGPRVFLSALIAMLLGDIVLYYLGRYSGWSLLGILCRLSVNPETCILRAAESFYKRGKRTLLFAKFIPGVNSMAPPLAGSMRMRFGQFVRFDLGGVFLYVLAYTTLGYLFHDFLALITRGFYAAGRVMETVVITALIAYLAYRIWVYWTHRIYRVVPRVQVEELARRLQEEHEGMPLIADVRSHGYYDADARRIKGSIRIEPNNLSEEVQHLPRDRDIYLYCT